LRRSNISPETGIDTALGLGHGQTLDVKPHSLGKSEPPSKNCTINQLSPQNESERSRVVIISFYNCTRSTPLPTTTYHEPFFIQRFLLSQCNDPATSVLRDLPIDTWRRGFERAKKYFRLCPLGGIGDQLQQQEYLFHDGQPIWWGSRTRNNR
jgi:hypothetical protein